MGGRGPGATRVAPSGDGRIGAVLTPEPEDTPVNCDRCKKAIAGNYTDHDELSDAMLCEDCSAELTRRARLQLAAAEEPEDDEGEDTDLWDIGGSE